MMMKMNKVLSLLLALVLLLGCLSPAASAAQSGTVVDAADSAQSTEGPLTLGNTTLEEANEAASGTAETEWFEDRFEGNTAQRFSETEAADVYAPEDVVSFIVEMDKEPLLATASPPMRFPPAPSAFPATRWARR